MSFKDIIKILKVLPKRFILIVIIAFGTIIAIFNEIGLESFLAFIGLGILGYLIAKLTWKDY